MLSRHRRTAANGIRLVSTGPDENLVRGRGPIHRTMRDLPHGAAGSDAVFAAYRQMYQYDGALSCPGPGDDG